MPNENRKDPVRDWVDEELETYSNEAPDAGSIDNGSVAVLSVNDLLTESRLPFELEDKTIIYFIDPKAITATDSARMDRFQKLTDKVLARLEKNANDADALATFERVTGEYIKFILPDIPDQLLAKLKHGQRGIILSHWTKNSGISGMSEKKAKRQGG